jgi:hypothetical protein
VLIALGVAVVLLLGVVVALSTRRPPEPREGAQVAGHEKVPDAVPWPAERLAPPPPPEPQVGPLVRSESKPERAPAMASAPAPKPKRIDEKLWMSADLVLVNAGPQGGVQHAVAIEQVGEPPAYKVLAAVEEEAAVQAAEAAWQSGVSIIADEPTLARRVFGRVTAGATLGEVDAEELSRKWREFRIVPRTATLAVFNDLRQVRTRVGYLASAREFDSSKGDEPWFRDVRGKQAEPYLADYAQAGTLRKGISDEVLQKLTGVDFLDVCMHHVAMAFSQAGEKRGVLNVYVVGDVSAIAAPENRSDMLRLHPIVPPRGDELRMRSESDRLIRESERLASELRGRVNDLGVPVTEWSKEMAYGTYDTDFRRPDFQTAQESKLLGISHVLMFRVRTPHMHGMYELSLRLVDARKGRLLWQGQGDRLKPEDLGTFDLAASPYLMNTGKLTLVELVSDVAIVDESTRAWSRGGVPLLLPEIRLKADGVPTLKGLKQKPPRKRPGHHEYNHPEEMWGQAYRLGFLESTQEPVQFRDLFSSRIQSIPTEGIAGVLPVETDGAIPPAHEMRYLVWRLAKFILPTAGRVTEVNQARVRLTLSRHDGLKQGDRLTAIRLTEPGKGDVVAAETVLPQELIVTAVTEADSVANIEQLEGADPSSAAIQVGDVVHRKPPRKIIVAVLPPHVDKNSAAAVGTRNLKAARGEAIDVKELTQYVGNQLCELLQNAMVRLRLPVAERSDLQAVLRQQKNENFDINPALATEVGRVTGATHVILSDIAPGLYNEAPVGLRVVEVDTGMRMEQINFKFKRAQLEAWKP